MNLPMNDLFGLAWSQLWQVTVLAAVVALVVRFACGRRPHLAHMLWLIVVLKCLTPPLWSSPSGVFSWVQVHRATPPLHAVGEGNLLANTAVADGTTVRLPVHSPVSSSRVIEPPPIQVIAARAPETLRRHWLALVSWTMAFALVWLTGAAGLASLFAWKWLAYRRVLRQSAVPIDAATKALAARIAERLGLRRRPRIVVISEPIGPAVFGLFRPAVVLPQEIVHGKRPEQIEPILAHEMVHVRRGDTYWGALQLAAEILWWFHPLVWWANREMCRERERCCDEEVVAGLRFRPATYARSLLDVLESRRYVRPALAVPGVQSMEITSKRLEDIMTRANRFHVRTPRWSWAVLAIAAVLVLPGRAIVLGQNSQDPNKEQQPASPATGKVDEQASLGTVVTGQVVDAMGNALPDAQVAVVGRSRESRSGSELSGYTKTLGFAKGDAQGNFHVVVPELSSAKFATEPYVLAMAHGYAPNTQPLGLDHAQWETTVRLAPEQVLRGRVVDSQGEPAANVRMIVLCKNALMEDMGPLPGWPDPVTTDAQGQFAIHGVNTDQGAYVAVVDERFAQWHFQVGRPGTALTAAETRTKYPYVFVGEDFVAQKEPTEEVTLAPPPSQIIEGQVVYEDTKKPASFARVTVFAQATKTGSLAGIGGQADAEGRFRMNPYPGNFFGITAYPPQGQPYLIRRQSVDWPQGAASEKVDLALPRDSAVLVHGKIVEAPSGQPVAGASVQYEGYSRVPEGIITGWQGAVLSDADGNFQISVPRGRGILFAYGPTKDYIYQTLSGWDFKKDPTWAKRHYVHGSLLLDLKPGAEPEMATIALRRGVTVKGRLVDAVGRPVAEALMLSRLCVGTDVTGFRCFPVTIRDGQFELHGLAPDETVPVYFLDAKNELGAVAEISGKSAEGAPPVVRLQPCGKAMARFVDAEGKPVVRHNPGLQIVVTPGPDTAGNMRGSKAPELASDQDFVANFDHDHYWNKSIADDDGRCTFPALIPGATYRILVCNKLGDWDEVDFTVKSGETLQLPDIVLKYLAKDK